MRNDSRAGPYVLIIVGLVFLAAKQGWLPNLRPWLAEWWPLILIVVGVALLLRRSRGEPKS